MNYISCCKFIYYISLVVGNGILISCININKFNLVVKNDKNIDKVIYGINWYV